MTRLIDWLGVNSRKAGIPFNEFETRTSIDRGTTTVDDFGNGN